MEITGVNFDQHLPPTGYNAFFVDTRAAIRSIDVSSTNSRTECLSLVRDYPHLRLSRRAREC